MPIRLNAFPAQFTPIPFENMAYIANEKEKRNDKADTELSAFAKLSKVNAITQDEELRTNEVHKYTNQVEALVKSTPSDKLGSILPQIKQIKKEFENNLNYGLLNVVQSRYNSQLASFTEKDEASKKFGESGGQHGMSYEDSALAKTVEANQQENLKQDEFGRWTTESKKIYSPISTIHTPAIHKLGIEYADKIKNQEVTVLNPNLTSTNKPGIYYNIETHREVSEADAREELVRNALLTNPIVAQYDNWKNSITGNDKKVTEAYKTFISNPNNLIQPDLENPGFYNSYSPTHPALLKEFDALLHPQVYESAKSIGALGAVNNNNDQIKFINAPSPGPGVSKSSFETPLNIPYNTTTNSSSTAGKIISMSGSWGPNRNVGSFYLGKVGRDAFTLTTNPEDRYEKLSMQERTDEFGKTSTIYYPLDQLRVLVASDNIPSLKRKDPNTYTNKDWELMVDYLKKTAATSTSVVRTGFAPNSPPPGDKEGKDQAADINNQIDGFMFVDGETGKLISGSYLQKNGELLESVQGYLSGGNHVSDEVGGKDSKFSFARPLQVTTKRGNTLYMGVNKAQVAPTLKDGTVNPNFVHHYNALIINKFTAAQRSGIVEPMSPGSNFFLVPNTKVANKEESFSIVRSDVKNKSVSPISVDGKSEFYYGRDMKYYYNLLKASPDLYNALLGEQ